MHDLAVLRKQARQTRSFPRLGPRRACAVAFERTLRWNSFGKPESSRMRRKSVSKRKLIFQVPMVRIHFPPAESPRTIGSAGDSTGSMSGVARPARVYRRERWAAYMSYA